MAALSNFAQLQFDYGPQQDLTLTSNTTSVEDVENVTVVKSADLTDWLAGPLTYTIVITNGSAQPLTNLILTDNLAPPSVYLTGSATLDDEPTDDVDFTGTLLTLFGDAPITVPASGGIATIKFSVEKA